MAPRLRRTQHRRARRHQADTEETGGTETSRRYLNAAEALRDAVNVRPLTGSYAAVIGWNRKYHWWAVYDSICGAPDDDTSPEILVATRHPKVALLALSDNGREVLNSISHEGLLS